LNTKDLFTRAIAGTIYIIVILIGLLGGRFWFMPIFAAILGFGLYEFYRMVEKNTTHAISKIFNIFSGVLIFFTAFLFLEKINLFAFPAAILAYLLALYMSAIIVNRYDILHAIIYSVFGQMYITLPLCLLMLLSYHFNLFDEKFHYVPGLAIFVFIWVNDTAAYFIGSLIGKHKFISRISPKKSVEGFIAGIVFTVIAGLIFAHLIPEYPTDFWVIFAFVVSIFGTLGDLFESLIKRTYDLKDTGTLIPGHGGILDRIDSVLIALPASYLFLMAYFELAIR